MVVENLEINNEESDEHGNDMSSEDFADDRHAVILADRTDIQEITEDENFTRESERNPDIDGGWAWIVFIGVAIYYFAMRGFQRSFGVLFAAIMDLYDESAAETSLIPSVCAAVVIFIGPVGIALSQRTSERVVVIIGALVMTSGFIVSYFATNLTVFIGGVGFLLGIGMGLTYGPCTIMMGKYFDKSRGTANSVTSCAGCAGMIVLPVLMLHLIEEYTVRGAMLIYGGIVMHTVLSGLVLRPMPRKTKNYGKKTESDHHSTVEEDVDDSHHTQITTSISDTTQESTHPDVNAVFKDCSPQSDQKGTRDKDYRPPHYENFSQRKSKSSTCCANFRSFLHDLFYYELLFNPSFVVVLIASNLSLTMIICQTIYLFAMTESMGFTKGQSAMFLSIIGGADIAGRIAAGILTDRKYIKHFHVMATACILSGISFCFVPLATSMYSMIPLVAVMGSSTHLTIILTMPALVALLGLELFPKALSITLLSHSIITTIIPSLLGLIKDWVGVYDPVFPLTGGLHILAGVLLLMYSLVHRRCT